METPEKKSVDFRRVLIVAAAIFFVDAYFWGQGLLAALTIFVAGFIFLPISIYEKIKFSRDSQRIKKHLVYVVSGFLVFISFYANDKLAMYRAESLVQNLELYRQKKGSYPEKLQQLVPKYYSSVPKAKISAWGEFYYSSKTGQDPMLFYVIYPPFYRNGYNFQSKLWQPFD